MLDALQRRAEYYAELDAMTPEQRAEHDAGMKELAAMFRGTKPATGDFRENSNSSTKNFRENPETSTSEPVSQRYTLLPHIYRELVNQLRDTAVKYQGCQNLREQISATLRTVIVPGEPDKEKV